MPKKKLATVRGALGGTPRWWVIEWKHERGRVSGRVVCALADASAHGIKADDLPRLPSPLPPPGEGAEWIVRERRVRERRKATKAGP